MKTHETITEDEVRQWVDLGTFDYSISRLTEILNGQYSLDDAREDILSFRPKNDDE